MVPGLSPAGRPGHFSRAESRAGRRIRRRYLSLPVSSPGAPAAFVQRGPADLPVNRTAYAYDTHMDHSHFRDKYRHSSDHLW
jgi:hypothetical protein